MNPCYIVKFKDLKSPQGEIRRVRLGRFQNLQLAEQRAAEAYGVPGYGELVSVHAETPRELLAHRVWRFAVRSLRIVIAAVIALFAYSWLFGSGTSIGDVPLSQLTINMVGSRLVSGVLGVGAAALCWFIAFGRGPEY